MVDFDIWKLWEKNPHSSAVSNLLIDKGMIWSQTYNEY